MSETSFQEGKGKEELQLKTIKVEPKLQSKIIEETDDEEEEGSFCLY